MKTDKWPGGVTAVEKDRVTVTAPTATEAEQIHLKADNEALRRRVAELEAMPLIRFTPVTEELPEHQGNYLCQFSDGDIETYPFVDGDGFGNSGADCFKVVGWMDIKNLPSASEQEAMNDYFAARIRYHEAKEKRAYKMNLELAARCDRLRQAGMGLSIELGEQSKALHESEMADVIGVQKEWDAAAKEEPESSLAKARAEAIYEAERHAISQIPFDSTDWSDGYSCACHNIKTFADRITREDDQQEAPSE